MVVYGDLHLVREPLDIVHNIRISINESLLLHAVNRFNCVNFFSALQKCLT